MKRKLANFVHLLLRWYIFPLPFKHVVSDQFVGRWEIGVFVAVIFDASVMPCDAKLRHAYVPNS